MMKYGAIIENALLFFSVIVFCGGSFFIDKENQISNLKNNAETLIKRQEGEDGEHFPSDPEDSVDGLFDILKEKLENSTSPASSSEATTAITAMLPATNETSTTFATTSLNVQLTTSGFKDPNIISTSGSTQSSTQSPILANETKVSIANAVNNSTGDANIKSHENAPKNNTTTIGWYSIFTTKFWKDQLYDQNYILAIVLPIAAGISLALIVVCACCILNRLCKRQRHIHIEKKNYYGRNADSDNKWMLLAPSSSDEEI